MVQYLKDEMSSNKVEQITIEVYLQGQEVVAKCISTI